MNKDGVSEPKSLSELIKIFYQEFRDHGLRFLEKYQRLEKITRDLIKRKIEKLEDKQKKVPKYVIPLEEQKPGMKGVFDPIYSRLGAKLETLEDLAGDLIK